MYSFQISGETLNFKTATDVFYPTATSELLIKSFCKRVKEPGKLLDLGCGVGVVGIVLAKLGFATMPIYASDLSKNAVALIRENAVDHGCDVVAKVGSLFDPWSNEKFNYIIDDVSGVAEDVAEISPWFSASVPCEGGKDGTELVSQVILDASKYLEPNGLLFFPVLSLSNTEKIIDLARKNFNQVQMLTHKNWYLPEDMKRHLGLLRHLQGEGVIRIEEKFGMVLWYTEIYVASH